MSRHSRYQEEADRLIRTIAGGGTRPKLLLHVCCAPCGSYVLEYLSAWFEIHVLYYNPNISPESEYDHRADELERLIREMPLPADVTFIRGEYAADCFETAVKGLEHEPEGAGRCAVCFRLRLGETARIAAAGGYDYFTTTLSISPHKNAQMLNTIGEELAAQYGVAWLPSDFKKKGGFQRSIELSAQFDLYRQDYCGCRYSRRSEQKQKCLSE